LPESAPVVHAQPLSCWTVPTVVATGSPFRRKVVSDTYFAASSDEVSGNVMGRRNR
jgi:hypothetical protein